MADAQQRCIMLKAFSSCSVCKLNLFRHSPLLTSSLLLLLSSGRSSRAYKVAGLTLLASLLIVGQALTIYFVLSQKSDVKSLRENINNLESELTKSRAGEEVTFSSDYCMMLTFTKMSWMKEHFKLKKM